MMNFALFNEERSIVYKKISNNDVRFIVILLFNICFDKKEPYTHLVMEKHTIKIYVEIILE